MKQARYQGNESKKYRNFANSEDVYVRNFSTGAKWLIGKVVRETGPVSYLIVLNDGRLIRRHVDHIRKRLDLEIPEVSL